MSETPSKFELMMKKAFKPGNPECAIFCCILALIMAILFLTIGFWKTLLIMGLLVVALFIGGVGDKKAMFKKAANKVAPAKDKVYKMKDLRVEKALQEARTAQAEAEEAVEDAQEEIEETKEELEEAADQVADLTEE